MTRGKRILGLLLICLSIFGIVGWEQWGKEQFLYDEVLVLRENVKKGTVITEAMVDVKAMDIDEPCLEFSEKEKIIGLQAGGFVHKGAPLFVEYFQEPYLAPDKIKNRYGMCLPTEWIASKPSALSRGDKVFLFFGERLVTSADVAEVTRDGAVEIIIGKEQAADICQVTVDGGKLALVYQ
ncbi:MAG: hypothetical protein IKK48_03815 [Firmicutes bacterium]|nr:hypothetical protein [Bacillota bacterium]